MNIGTLTIEMAANVARLRQDMDAAKRTVDNTMRDIRKSVEMAKNALVGLGAGLSVAAFASWIKQSIDAADEMSKLAQKTGIAVKDLAGLQLAYRQSGLEAGALQQSMGKLSVAVVNGSDALKAMGVQTRNTDGTLKSTRQILGEVADRFAGYQDGIGKTALAIELFGKSGAELIPLLNGGSAALAEFDEVARKLGLTLDEETARNAEKFNDTLDLVGQGMSGISRQVAGNLLPTLTALAGQFLSTMTEGDKLKRIADVLSVGLRSLYIAGLLVVETFKTLGSTLGAAAAQIVAVLQGNFSQAAAIGREWAADTGASWKETLEQVKNAWNATGDSSVEAMAAAAAASKKAAPEVGKVNEEAKKAAEAFEALRAKITGKDVGLDADFAKNMQTLRDAFDSGRISLAEFQALAEQYIKQQKFYQDQLKATNDELDKYFEAEEKARLEKEKSIKSAREMVEEIEFETAALKMTNEQREIAIKLRELERAGIKAGSAEYEIFAQKIKDAVIGKQAVEESIEQQRKALADWQKTWDQVGQSLTDALMQGGKSAADYIKGLFRSMVLKPILQPIVGGVLASFGLGGSSAAMAQGQNSISSALGLGNLVASIRGVYSAVTGGFTALGDTVAFAAQDIGAWLVQNTTGVLNSAGASIMQAAGTIGTVAQYATGALAGYAVGSAISGKYSAFGNANVSNIAGTAIGALLGGPFGAVLGGAIGGLVNRAFGRGPVETTATGITGTFASSGASVQQFQDWRQDGGWFRSDRSGTNFSAVSGELQALLDVALQATSATVRQYVGLLGMSADAVGGFSQSIRLNLQGLSAEDQQKAIADALSAFGDAMVSSLFAEVTTVARTGETAGQTLARLATSIQTVNGVFGTLNLRLDDASVAGADAASALLDMFGGIENFVQATDFYYQNFYTEAERASKTTEQLTQAMTALGLTLPNTREGFRALVEAARAAGDNQLFARLMSLAPAFASVTLSTEELAAAVGELDEAAQQSAAALRERAGLERQLLTLQGNTVELRARELAGLDETNRAIQQQIWALEDANAAYDNAKTATDSAMAAVQRAISAASQAAEKVITDAYNRLTETLKAQLETATVARDAANENLNAIRGVFDLLKSQIADLVGAAGAGMTSAQGNSFIDQAILTARSTGYLPEQDQLSAAIMAARSGIESSNYSTSFEMRRDRLMLAGKLSELQALAGDQMTIAERQLAAAEQQVASLQDQIEQARLQYEADMAQNKAYYDGMLQAAQAQLDAMRGVNNSVLSVAAAMANLASAIASERAAQAAAAAASAARSSAAANPTYPAGQGGYQLVGNTLYFPGGGTHSVAGSNGANLLIDAYGLVPGPNGTMIRTRAAGGYTPPGMTLVGEEGPELVNFEKPGMVYTATQTASMVAGAGVAEELRQLRSENQAQARAMVQLQSRMTRLLERWDGDGLPEERSVTA